MKQISQNGKNYFICEECGFAYLEEALAQQCEDWCKQGKG
ncbi:hypothetical protein Dform_01515 [Dehalogenimonas formicexedens]|uniref:Uncharacterized protein n=1 Tax=Dehalogenimonas formicexedens TaxID=1839801 RepID=A0A1P8F8P4_9CHLR|nr:hypothetical protein Dform_01515 [Dehalogenimonas formicexedens]